MSVIGRLRALLSLESAEFLGDVGKVKSATKDLQGGFGDLAVKVKGLGPALAGSQQATAAAAQAMKLMGAEGSAAVAGLSNALSGLVSSGFTPWGIAIAGVTALLGTLWSTKGSDELVKKHAKEVEDVEKRYLSLAKAIDAASLGRRAGAAGVGDEEQSLRDRAKAIQDRLAGRLVVPDVGEEERLAMRQALRDFTYADVKPGTEGESPFRQLESGLKLSWSAAVELREELGLIQKRLADLEASRVFKAAETASAASAISELTEEYKALVAAVAGESAAVDPGVRRAQESAAAYRLMVDQLGAAKSAQDALFRDFEEMRGGLLGESPWLSPEDEALRAKLEKVREEILGSKRDLAFEIDQLDRDETERAVAEHERRYEKLLELGERYGVDVVALRKLIDEKSGKLRAAGGEKPKEDRGFGATLKDIADLEKLQERVGGFAAYGLSDGVAGALEEIALNAKSAKEAFRDFATSFFSDVARMINQALIAKAILSLFPGLSPGPAGAAGDAASGAAAAAVPAATGAHGGTWRVGGFGGLDSQMVRMKLSPGELVRVTNGANSGGGADGPVNVALTIRPPAVIADDVMAKSSRDARAAVVATALHRGGRRGARARD